jgi:hypothetical protein
MAGARQGDTVAPRHPHLRPLEWRNSADSSVSIQRQQEGDLIRWGHAQFGDLRIFARADLDFAHQRLEPAGVAFGVGGMTAQHRRAANPVFVSRRRCAAPFARVRIYTPAPAGLTAADGV